MKTSRVTAAIQTQTSNNIQLQFITPNIKTDEETLGDSHLNVYVAAVVYEGT